ncbi:hypothetical protein [Streptacidiphilus rugosus]|uniref:hypothetical protein n=1 Tax=Streptacidiphilus rugosus TaxID=405783 RepID=UPI00068EDA28|nr:hypothetical protein [Streptacidiphilus rugosus]
MSSRLRRAVSGSLAVAALTAVMLGGGATSASAHAYESQLVKGEYLGAGDYIQRLTLTGGDFTLIMQSDGNLVEYRDEASYGRKVCWASNTRYHGGTHVVYQNDGNFVMYPDWSTKAVWSSNTYNGGGSTVDINKFGVIYVGTTPITGMCS